MLLRSETINTGREIADGLQFPGALGKTDVELVFELEYHFDHGERIDRELVHTRRRVNELRRDFELLRENLPQFSLLVVVNAFVGAMVVPSTTTLVSR